MSNLSKYTDEEMLEIAVSDIEKEMNSRGYEYGWYKKTNYVGVIYILVNPAFQNLVKIGYADDVEKRIKSLNSSSGLPDPYHCYAIYKVKKRLEDLRLHTLIDSLDPTLRHAKNREFYEISKEKAYAILSAIAQINGDEDCLILNPFNDSLFMQSDKENKVEHRNSDKLPPLTFETLNIPIGSELVYVKDESIKVKTVDNRNKVEYKGKIYSTSGLARLLLGNNYPAQGPMYFKYKGKVLTALRKEMGV